MKTITPAKVWSVQTLSLILILGLCHCGDDSSSSPFDGFYETVSQQKKEPCDAAWEDQSIDQQYFKLETTSMLGVKILARYECTTDNPSSCSDSLSLFQSMNWSNGQWAYELTISSYTDDCQISQTKGVPVLSELGFDIELVNRQAEVSTVSQEDCDTDLADTIADDDFACQFREKFQNTRLQ